MTIDGLYEFVYDWLALSIDNNIPVILGEQDSPIPTTGVYMVIHQPYGIQTTGMKILSGLTITTETVPGEEGQPDTEIDVARRTHSSTYYATISIEEVRGRGALLTEFLTKIDFEDVQNHFRANKVGFMRADTIVPVNVNINGNWYTSATLDVQLSFVIEAIELSNWIETVELAGSVSGGMTTLEIEQII